MERIDFLYRSWLSVPLRCITYQSMSQTGLANHILQNIQSFLFGEIRLLQFGDLSLSADFILTLSHTMREHT